MKKRLHLSYETLTLIVLAGAAALLASPISAAAADVEQPTYVEHIAPLLHANCVSCHRPGEIAPMSLRTYPQFANKSGGSEGFSDSLEVLLSGG